MNYKVVKILSEYSFKNNIYFIHFSTDYVYSGKEKNMEEKIFASPLIITVIPNILVKMQ